MNTFLKVGILGSFLSCGLQACQKAPFKEVPKEKVENVIVNRVDSFISESKKVLQNDKYQIFEKDTIELTKDFFNNPKEFFKYLDEKAKTEVPRVVIRTYTVMVPSVVHKWRVVEPQTRHEYAKKFIEPKSVILSDKIYTRDSIDRYVPVEFWGISNPELKDKNLK